MLSVRVQTVDGKAVDKLTKTDLEKYPVWEYDLSSEGTAERDETWVVPVTKLPVRSLDNRVVGTRVTLADGTALAAFLGNMSLSSREITDEFLVVTIFFGRASFQLARYFDSWAKESGPLQLAKFLRRSPKRVFPIRWDLNGVAEGHKNCLSGEVLLSPRRRLTERQRLKLINAAP
jgi:hypothetical protein